MDTIYSISDVFMAPGYTEEELANQIAARVGVPRKSLAQFQVTRMGVDARKKNRPHYVISAIFSLKDGAVPNAHASLFNPRKYEFPFAHLHTKKPPVIVGSGPAGMFCALQLAKAGLHPIVLERGACVEERVRDTEALFARGHLYPESNVQFGEGGAGTFSDGKLQTGTKDVRQRMVLEAYVKAGATRDILYMTKPHIGTDILRTVARNLRLELVRLGGWVEFGARLDQIRSDGGHLRAIRVRGANTSWEIDTDHLILAPGNAARDTFEMLHAAGVTLEAKNFAVGVRLENLQRRMDVSQYGPRADFFDLPAASYKLVHHSQNARSVYSFCVCPGGYVVCGASANGEVVTNGMSNHDRGATNINGALVVGVTPEDFGSDSPLAGIAYQRRLERAAYEAGGRNFYAPVQLVGDFLRGYESTCFGSVRPTFRPGTTFYNLRRILPDYITEALLEAIPEFGKRIRGFAAEDGVLTAVETRTSSPVRICRDKSYQTNISGIYACGEGSGYAGGIMSSAVDGIRCAEMVCATI